MSKLNEFTIYCSNCDNPLAGVIMTDETVPVENRIRVKCPFCGDYSFWKTFSGTYCFGGVAMPNPKDKRDEIPLTRYVDEIWDDESVTYIMAKENSNADPRECRA